MTQIWTAGRPFLHVHSLSSVMLFFHMWNDVCYHFAEIMDILRPPQCKPPSLDTLNNTFHGEVFHAIENGGCMVNFKFVLDAFFWK